MDALRKLLLLCLLLAPTAARAQTITNLPAASIPLSGAEQVPCVQTGVTKRCNVGGIAGLAAAPAVISVTSGATVTVAPLSLSPVTLLSWNSASASAKTSNIPACVAALAGNVIVVKDDYGEIHPTSGLGAGVYQINIVPATGTVLGQSSYAVYSNGAAMGLACDGVSNWMGI